MLIFCTDEKDAKEREKKQKTLKNFEINTAGKKIMRDHRSQSKQLLCVKIVLLMLLTLSIKCSVFLPLGKLYPCPKLI